MKPKIIFAALALSLAVPCQAQSVPVLERNPPALEESIDSTATISSTQAANEDREIAARLEGIYRELQGLRPVQVTVKSGVVVLSGTVAQPEDVDRARQIAMRVNGVVAVQNNLKHAGDVSEALSPVMARLNGRLQQFIQLVPLVAVALVIMVLFWLLGTALSRAQSFWRRVSPNSFLADLVATTARLLIILLGIVIALDLLGATTLLGAILGSAGVVGLAIGFAVKDTVDNYVSSIMLSIRQPFRANDHVVIGDREGLVIRLTSRATILMTLDGNHLRIPNSTVFRSEILNYTRNSERRFDFTLGIDAQNDPGEAMRVGIERLRELSFLLRDPAPGARLDEVGDSNIALRFLGWIDQTETDWFKARSAAIRAVKITLEAQGFGLPEPTYRLRFDKGSPLEIALDGEPAPERHQTGLKTEASEDHQDVSVQNNIEEKVIEERARSTDEDMLDDNRPIE